MQMKITFVTSTLTSGGSERVISILANELSKRKHVVEIISLNKHIVFYKIEDNVKLSFAKDETNDGGIIRRMSWLRKHIKDSKPDVVIPFMEAVYCVTLLSLVGLKVPVVSSERIDPRRSPFLRNVLRRIILPLTTHLVVQTEDIKRFYPTFIQKKTSVVYNPVTDVVYGLPVTKKKNIVVSVGRLYIQKNQKMLIDAFAGIAKEFENYNLIIYGEGPLRGELEKQIKNKGLEGRVLLPGAIDNVLDKLNEAKIFCLSSNYEGMSNALIEAICVGLPVISTRVSGVDELIKTHENGEIVNIGDTITLTKTLRSLLLDENRMKAYGIRNKQMSEIFKTENIVNQWESLLKGVIENYGQR